MAIVVSERGPRPSPMVGNTPAIRRDPFAFLERLATYGDLVPFRMMRARCYFVNHPALIQQVLVDHARIVHKMPIRGTRRAVFGDGLLSSDGALWLRQRRLMQPLFHRDRVSAYAAVAVEQAEAAVAGWASGARRDVHRDMMATTLQIVARALFSTALDADVATIGGAMETITARIEQELGGVRIPMWLPTAANRRFASVMAQVDAVIHRLIADRRADPTPRGDLLSALMQSRDESGAGMSDRQLRDELLTFFLAGHETTALALSWTLYLLARHPAVRAALEAEVDAVVGARPLGVDDIPRLRYADRVLKEAMRLYPPSWALTRYADAEVEIAGRRIEKGSVVLVSQWAMHRDARYFADPLRFDPDRWTDDFVRALPRYAYFPFGGGPRVCIGAAFAQVEALAILAVVARHARLDLAPDARVEPQPSVTLRPRHGVPMVVARR